MTQVNPKISVIVPVFNGEKFISRCLDSILGQTYANLEIIVVDDGSTDNTKNIINANYSKVRYYFQENKGPAAARNLGIRKSTGAYIAFIDVDDIWLPDKLSQQAAILLKEKEIALVHTNVQIMHRDGVIRNSCYPTYNQNKRMFEPLLLQTGSVVCSTVLLRKTCLENVGYFNEHLQTAEDVHLFLRLSYYYKFYFIDKPLIIKHHHDANLTNANNPRFGEGTLEALRLIEQEFPEYAMANSKLIRYAFFLRLRLMSINLMKKGDYRGSFKNLREALKYSTSYCKSVGLIYRLFETFIRNKMAVYSS